MAPTTAQDVSSLLRNVASCNAQFATVFHTFALGKNGVPRGLESVAAGFDGLGVVVNKVLAALPNGYREGERKRLILSEEGLGYVAVLGRECKKCFVRVERVVLQGQVGDGGEDGRREAEMAEEEADSCVLDLKLDEKVFLEAVENARWKDIITEIEDCVDRLGDIQLHLLLVSQVVAVGELSRDL